MIRLGLLAAGALGAMVVTAWAQPPATPPYVRPLTADRHPPDTLDPYFTGLEPSPWLRLGTWHPPQLDSWRDRLRWRVDYLHWWTAGMDLPPLVATSPAGTPPLQAAVWGEPGTEVLFGGGEINAGSTAGFRYRSGLWLTPGRTLALESEYVQVGDQSARFSASGDGAPILGRPFFDMDAGQESAVLVSFPGLTRGSIGISAETEVQSYLINLRGAFMPVVSLPCDGCPPTDRVDWIVGYRRLELNDRISVRHDSQSDLTAAPELRSVREAFQSTHEFHGLQLGVIQQMFFRRVYLESMLRLAIGNNRQRVHIDGSTSITTAGTTETFPGGLLAQRTNIGSYRRDEFTMVPELNVTAGIRLTDCLYATVGYGILYIPNVVRAGEPIDRDVHPELIPVEAPPATGPLRPEFRFIQNDYWAHGLNVGAEVRF